MDDCDELILERLHHVKGIVGSEGLLLNTSGETLQRNKILRKKYLANQTTRGNFALFYLIFFFLFLSFACASSRPAPFSPSPFFLPPSHLLPPGFSVLLLRSCSFCFCVVCGLPLSPLFVASSLLLSLSYSFLLVGSCFVRVVPMVFWGPSLPFLARFATSRLLSLRLMWVRSFLQCFMSSALCHVRQKAHGLLDLHLIVEFVLFPFGIFWSRVSPRPLALWLCESDPEDVVRLPVFSAFCLLVRDVVLLLAPTFRSFHADWRLSWCVLQVH